jgi:hypothetical protein
MDKLIYPLKAPQRQRDGNKQMQVLCLGLSRQGTDSLRRALLILGYRDVYHGFVVTAKQREDCAFWVPLMRRKLRDSRHRALPLGEIDFDSVLATCEAVTDAPANVLGLELMAFYPQAKVILNRRKDTEAWYKSMQKTCVPYFSWPMWTLSWFDSRFCWLWWNFEIVFKDVYHGDFNLYGKQVAEQHYEDLARSCREQDREYLNWSVEDGW